MTVLIDTWWNVNHALDTMISKVNIRFNRYMVECESVDSSINAPFSLVLIDTWWNVNLHSRIALPDQDSF